MSLRVVLAGFHWTGRKVLEHLLQRDDVREVAVFTHPQEDPDLDLSVPAAREGLFVSSERISASRLPFRPDIVASVYYRNIIKADVISVCDGRIFNMHPSLLPRHRGCSSVPWAMIEGDTVTGVSFHYIDEGIDTGPLILQASVPIFPTDTQADLYRRCMVRGVAFWPAAFTLVAGGFPGVPQEGAPSYHRRGAPEGGELDPNWPLDRIERFIRAMQLPPLPCARMGNIEIPSMETFLDLRRVGER